MPLKNNPGCNCCDVVDCTYDASDGTEYSNDFSSAVGSGWSQNFPGDSWSCSSGRLRVLAGSGGGASNNGVRYFYRTSSMLTATGLKLIMECDLYEYSDETVDASGIGFDPDSPPGNGPGTTRPDFLARARWDANSWEFRAFGSIVSHSASSPSSGDKATISLQNAGDTDYLACFFVNETLVASTTGTISLLPSNYQYCLFTERFGAASPPPWNTYGEFSNFSIELNP